MLDSDLLKFIANEIKAIHEKNKNDLIDMQETVIQMMNHMLKNGMPMENLDGPRQSYFVENAQAINSEKALLIILSTISSNTGKISNITWPTETAFLELISRLQSQRTGPDNFILGFLNHLHWELI